MNAADELPEPDEPLKTHIIKLPSRDQVTAIQVNTLLQAVQSLNHLVVARFAAVGESRGGADDGGVSAALDSTIARACTQLDNIFDEATRWNLSQQDSLEKQLADIYAEHLDLLRVQKEAVRGVGLPHRIAGPKLLQLEDGEWWVILGDPAHLDSCLIGKGDSPAAALADFDDIFNGTKNKNEQKSDSLDDGGSATGENPPNTRKDIRGNWSDNEPDGGVGSA